MTYLIIYFPTQIFLINFSLYFFFLSLLASFFSRNLLGPFLYLSLPLFTSFFFKFPNSCIYSEINLFGLFELALEPFEKRHLLNPPRVSRPSPHWRMGVTLVTKFSAGVSESRVTGAAELIEISVPERDRDGNPILSYPILMDKNFRIGCTGKYLGDLFSDGSMASYFQ